VVFARRSQWQVVVEETDALGAARYFTYDDGDLVRYVDRNGSVRHAEHRITSETWCANVKDGDSAQSDLTPNPESLLPTRSSTKYDEAGRLVAEPDDNSSIVYVYEFAEYDEPRHAHRRARAFESSSTTIGAPLFW